MSKSEQISRSARLNDFSCNFNQAEKEEGETLQLTAAAAGGGEYTQSGMFLTSP